MNFTLCHRICYNLLKSQRMLGGHHIQYTLPGVPLSSEVNCVFFCLHTYQYFVQCKSRNDPQACCWPHLLVQLVLMVQLCRTEIKTVWKLWLNMFPIYNLWSRVFLVTVSCFAGQEIPTFYGTWRFIIMFTGAHSLQIIKYQTFGSSKFIFVLCFNSVWCVLLTKPWSKQKTNIRNKY